MAKVVLKAETDKLIIELNQKTCISCGTCSVIAPKTFEQDSNYITILKSNPGDSDKKILEAAQSCAVDAITLIDKTIGKKLHPK